MLLTLPHDVLDRVLTSLDAFDTLSAAIRTCKTLYDVFETRHASIVRTIAFNVVGPALPLAICHVNGASSDNWLTEAECAPPDVHFTRNQAEILVYDAATIYELENIFSWRYKDRRSATSTLAPTESLRFHAACYHFWIYCRKFEHLHWDTDLDSQGDEYAGARAYLNALPTKQLMDVDRVTSFCADVLRWAAGAHYRPERLPHHLDSYIADTAGVVAAFHGYGSHTLSTYVAHEFRAGFFDDVMHAVLDARRLLPKRAELQARAILSGVVGGQDRCYRCDSTISFATWGPFGPSNLRLLQGELNPQALVHALPGYLPRNPVEIPSLRESLAPRSGTRRVDYAELFVEMLSMPSTPGEDVVGPDGRGWVCAGDVWYCAGCLGLLAGQRLWRWWVERQRKANVVMPEDCWYGWNCRTQIHKEAHATTKNHFCRPIKGDP